MKKYNTKQYKKMKKLIGSNGIFDKIQISVKRVLKKKEEEDERNKNLISENFLSSKLYCPK